MSTAPSETGCLDSFATNLQDKTGPATSTQPAKGAATALAAPSAYKPQAALLMDGLTIDRPTNFPLGVFDLTLSFIDDTPIRGNKIPIHDETPIKFTVKFTNRPENVKDMVMSVILSQLSKDSYRKGESGSFAKYVNSTTYEATVPINDNGPEGYSISIEVGHADAPNGGFHGGDGPYDAFISFSPAGTGGHEQAMAKAMPKAMLAAAEHDAEDEEDEEYPSQVAETLRYTFYNHDANVLARLYYAVWKFWDGLILARLYYATWRLWERF